MGVYRREGSSYLWISYTHEGRRYFESAETADHRAASRVLADRRRNGPPPERVAPEVLTVRRYFDAWIARRVEAGVRTAHDERVRLERFVLPTLGERALVEVTRSQVRDVIAAVSKSTSSATGKLLAPRTVLHVYAALRLLFADALTDELITSSPCTLKTRKGELPLKRDADPRWRSSSIYTRAEAASLISDERLPLDRRVYYALGLLAGMRSSEIAGVRWRDYDAAAEPLGRLLVASQADEDDATGDRETKTLAVRDVPVHPTLAQLLEQWRRHGFPLLFGRHPRPDDWIVPSRADVLAHRSKKMLERLKEDLERLGLRTAGRGRHAMRATFITLAQVDGARREILEAVTHAGRGDVVSGYSRWPWEAICAEVAKLRVELEERAPVVAIGNAGKSNGISPDRDSVRDTLSIGAAFARETKRGGRDSKRSPDEERQGIQRTHGDKAGSRGPKNAGNAPHEVQRVTPVTTPNEETLREAIAELRRTGRGKLADALEATIPTKRRAASR